MLFGRPWLFDRKVKHDGYLNTFSFSNDGKMITFAPLGPSQIQKNKPQKNPHQADLILTFGQPLLKASYHEFNAFKEWILTALEEPEYTPPNHPFALSLLEQFSHVFPDDIPSGLLAKGPSSTTLSLILEPYSQISLHVE